LRVFRPIDESDEIAIVEVAKPVYLIRGLNGLADTVHDLRREFKAQVHASRTDVE